VGTFEVIEKYGDHEQVVFCHDKSVGLKAIIAIHDTTLGPALGGTRMWPYKTEDEALIDVLRLSKGMTYKASAAGLNLGGGKAVIIGDPKKDKTEGLFRAFGQFVNSLNGRYITAEDVGTSVVDMEYIFMESPWVTGIPKSFGGSGDPSPFTAHGVLMGIKAAAEFALNTKSLKGLNVAVQGLGHVGYYLVEYLAAEGAHIFIADIDQEKATTLKEKHTSQVTIVSPDKILSTPCDILAPCAMGAIINDKTLAELKTKVIAGGANNQLAEPRHGQNLKELGILYTPDYVINAGGLMNVFSELEGYHADRAMEKTKRVYENCMKVFEIAKKENCPTQAAADKLAEDRLKTMGQLRKRHPGKDARSFSTLKEVFNR